MTIKKLTVAAAIAVGIATCSLNGAMAACPLSGCQSCQPVATPACGCAAPCATPCATPCAPACDCAAPCAPACDCGCNTGCAAPCCKPASPTCAVCAGGSRCGCNSCNDLDMKQVYGYPSAIYGTNNYTGEQSNAIYSTETAWCLDRCDALGLTKAGFNVSGMTGAACGCGCGSGSGMLGLTGMACGCGCNGMPRSACCGGCQGGAIVNRLTTCGSRNCNAMPDLTGAACGCSSMPVITGAACGCGSETLPAITGAACGCGCGTLPTITGAACGCGCGSNPCCTTTIQTCNSIDALKKSFTQFQTTGAAAPMGCSSCGCGAAAPLVNAFPDVPDGYWAACPIDKLAMNDIIVGYPDRTFKPGKCVSRAEFATMMVKGLNLNCAGLESKCLFKDVPTHNWANPLIAKAVDEGLMCGYPNNMFKPKQAVSRVEALTAMAHGINCEMSCDKAQQVLSQYCDGSQVPSWAQIPIAKALDAGVLKTSLDPKTIGPCNNASRAEIADMLQNLRITVGYDKNPTTACECPKPAADACCPKTAYMEQCDNVKIPTLKLCFRDEINAKSSNVGDIFAANTSEEVTINGTCYPKGSRVNGKIVEVIRPSGCERGALKLAFTNIENCNGCKCDLPRQILTAQIDCARTQNIFARIIETPFTLVGGLIGTTGRTVGGVISSLGNAAEAVSGSVGIASGELLQGPCVWPAAGRSLQDAARAAIMAPIDATRTTLAGAAGLFQTTTDEVAYLVDPNGSRISAINPKEKVTIAFGCSGQ